MCVSQTSTCRSHSRNQFSYGGTLTYICCPDDSPALSTALCCDPKFHMSANPQNNHRGDQHRGGPPGALRCPTGRSKSSISHLGVHAIEHLKEAASSRKSRTPGGGENASIPPVWYARDWSCSRTLERSAPRADVKLWVPL